MSCNNDKKSILTSLIPSNQLAEGPRLETLKGGGFINLTDPRLQCFETLDFLDGVEDRVVYKCSWSGGGGIVTRVFPSTTQRTAVQPSPSKDFLCPGYYAIPVLEANQDPLKPPTKYMLISVSNQ